jgi:hypothetical protein
MTELLKIMTDASPLVVIVFAIIWVVNRVFLFATTWRGDPRFESLGKSIDRLSDEMVRQGKSTRTAYTHESNKITEALKNLEAATINHAIVHERCAFVSQVAGNQPKKDEALPLNVQRTLLEYQWKWCRDSFVRILSQSIRNNGIRGQELGVCTRVVSALYHAAADSKKSVERVDGMDEYQFAPLYDRDIPEMIHALWEKAVPLYHRDVPDSLDAALEEFALWVHQLFEDRLSQWLLVQEDPDTGRLYHRDDPVACTGQFDLTKALAEQLRFYEKGRECDSDCLPPTPLVKKY